MYPLRVFLFQNFTRMLEHPDSFMAFSRKRRDFRKYVAGTRVTLRRPEMHCGYPRKPLLVISVGSKKNCEIYMKETKKKFLPFPTLPGKDPDRGGRRETGWKRGMEWSGLVGVSLLALKEKRFKMGMVGM